MCLVQHFRSADARGMATTTYLSSHAGGAHSRLARILLAFLILASVTVFGVAATPAPAFAKNDSCSRGVNLSWESPVIGQNWRGVPQGEVAGWSSESGVIEIWTSGFLGATAPDGGQLSELQANDNRPSWQDIPTLPGDRIDWSFYHRGRANTDTVVVRMGSPSSLVDQGTFSTGTAAFVQYSGTYMVPDGQTTTRFMLDPQDGGSVGNLVDAVTLSLECGVSIASSVASTTDVDGSGDVSLGDEVGFLHTVSNPGTASLTVDVSESLGDAVSCPLTLLAPDAVMDCTATHVVTQADVDAGSVTSEARATGTDAAGVTLSGSDTVAVDIDQRPDVSIVKTGSVDPTFIAPDTRPDAGDMITYGFSVANTGNVTLGSIDITDVLATVSCPETSLAPGADMDCAASYLIQQPDVDVGGVDNTAIVTAVPPAGEAIAAEDSISTVLDGEPALSVVKVAGVKTYTTPGDELEYSITVVNAGNTTLFDVSVSDDTADRGSLSCDAPLPGELLPGAVVTCAAGHTITQADIDDGAVANTATATGQDPAGDPVLARDTATVTAEQHPSIDITKSAAVDPTVVGPDDRVDAGDRVEYTITATNTGNVTVSEVTVSDPSIPALDCGRVPFGPGASITCTGFDAIAQVDIDAGGVSNTADVTAVDPSGEAVEATTTIATPIDQVPELALVKAVSTTSHGDGSFDFSYSIDVANHGNTTLTGVQIEDDLRAVFGELVFSIAVVESDDLTVNPTYDGATEIELLAGSDSLLPGESGRIELVVLVHTEGESGPFSNAATVVAEGGSEVAAISAVGSADASVDVAFDLAMTVSSQTAVAPGQNATWTLDVTNAGPSVAPGPITVTNTLDNRVSFLSASGPGWSCNHVDGLVTCVRDTDLVAGSATAITLVTRVNADAGAAIVNVAAVSAVDSSNEATIANNSDAATLQVDALPLTGVNLDTLGRVAFFMMLIGGFLLGFARRSRRGSAD